jgi:TolA-binding protein
MSMFDRVARSWKFASLLGTLAVLGLGKFACRSGSEVDASEAVRADAAQAKNRVTQIRRKQAQAEREVHQHSQQIADAAREVGAEMEKRVAEMQRDQRSQASAATEQGVHRVSPHEVGQNTLIGLLEGVGPGWVSVRDGSGFEYVIKTDAHTRITGPGKSVDLSKLPQGSQLSVEYVFKGKDRVARDVDVLALYRPDGA